MVQDLIVSFQKFQTHHNSSGHQTKLLGSFCPPMLKSQTSSYHRRSPHFRVPTVSVAKHGTETSFITQTIAAINMRRLFLAEANASNKGKVCHLRPKHHWLTLGAATKQHKRQAGGEPSWWALDIQSTLSNFQSMMEAWKRAGAKEYANPKSSHSAGNNK